MSERFQVQSASPLLPFLHEQLKGWPRRTIKQRLQAGCVMVNGKATTKHDHALQVGDKVEIQAAAKRIRAGAERLEVLYADPEFIAINKPAGLLAVGNPREQKQHALAILRKQLSRPRQNVKLWPVNRLDRETSGIMLFATSRKLREALAAEWSNADKVYLAIVEGKPSETKGTIDQPLWQDPDRHEMHVGEHPSAQQAVTRYEVLRSGEERSLLRVRLETGRQHQIRAHLAWLGHPVVGDGRYGTGGKRLGLHAQALRFPHPVKEREIRIELDPPPAFEELLP